MGLEEVLYGSKTVRNFLKYFSDQHWNRVSKATILLGIQYLTEMTGNDIRSLSVKDIEQIVVDFAGGKILKPQNSEYIEKPKRKERNDKKKKKDKKEKRKKIVESSPSIVESTPAESSPARSSPVRSSRGTETEQSEIAVQVLKVGKQKQKESSRDSSVDDRQSKPSSQWRRGGQSADQKQPYKSRFEQPVFQAPRAASLNPQIYPAWWGEDDAIEEEVMKQQVKKNGEDDLDKRLREARDNKHKQPKFATEYQRPPVYQQQQQAPNDRSPGSFAFTSGKYAQKYSPAKPQPGASNIPMSYAGPPTIHEMNRNFNRPEGGAYGRENIGYQRQENLGNVQHTPQQPIRQGGYMASGGGGGGGISTGGGVVISYSPPRSKSRDAQKPRQGQSKKQVANQKAAAAERRQKMMSHRPQPGSNRKYQNVESKIKNQVRQHKQQARTYNKEPQILASKPPSQQYNRDNNGSAALRRRSPQKNTDLSSDQMMSHTQGNWPSSIENVNNSNIRSTGQNFYRRNPGGRGDSGAGDISQDLVSSPITKHFSDQSSPEKLSFQPDQRAAHNPLRPSRQAD